MAAMNAGESCDEKRLDHLLLCLEWNKDYMKGDEQKRIDRITAITALISESVVTMRGYVPVDVSQ